MGRSLQLDLKELGAASGSAIHQVRYDNSPPPPAATPPMMMLPDVAAVADVKTRDGEPTLSIYILKAPLHHRTCVL